jgi:hypothetical protein
MTGNTVPSKRQTITIPPRTLLTVVKALAAEKDESNEGV